MIDCNRKVGTIIKNKDKSRLNVWVDTKMFNFITSEAKKKGINRTKMIEYIIFRYMFYKDK